MTRKERIETLRKRGFEWRGGEPLRRLPPPKWLPFVDDDRWLTLSRWVDEANLLDDQAVSQADPSLEVLRALPTENFSIRQYRSVEPAILFHLLRNVHQILNSVVSQPRPGGIEHIEPDPFTLFMFALATANPSYLHICSVCGKFLYAMRSDQRACSGSCSNTARQRRFRIQRKRYEQNRKKKRVWQKNWEQERARRRLRELKDRPR